MKNLLLSAFLLLTFSVFSQITPSQPRIMVVPSNALMNNLGYLKTINNQGAEIYVPNYMKAFTKNADLKQVISKIGEMFSERGFPLVDMELWLNTIQQERTEDILKESKSGGEISISPLDEVLYRAKPDIYIELTYEVENAGGPMRVLKFNIQAKDAFTKKQIGAASGVGQKTTETILIKLLEEAVFTHLNNLQSQMQTHFDDLSKNGREIFVRVQVFDDAGFDLEEEFGTEEDELGEIIADWLKKNSVNYNSRLLKQTENEIRFNIRIPLYDADFGDTPMGAYEFSRKLKKYLKKSFGVKTKNLTQSLGDANLIIKGKK